MTSYFTQKKMTNISYKKVKSCVLSRQNDISYCTKALLMHVRIISSN